MGETKSVKVRSLNSAIVSPRRVVKIGGSLLDLPDLEERVLAWLETQTPMHTVWVVGGGAEVDTLREFDREHSADQDAMHWAAIEVMSHNTTLIKRKFPATFKSLVEIGPLGELLTGPTNANVFFDCTTWLQSNRSLPRTWDVTSDAIAVSLAGELRACEIILLKSVGSAQEEPISKLTQQGVIDGFMETALAETRKQSNDFGVELRLSLVNLRAD